MCVMQIENNIEAGKNVDVVQMTISNEISCLKIGVFWLEFHGSVFLASGPIDNKAAFITVTS